MSSKEIKALFAMLVLMTIAFTAQSFVLLTGQEDITSKQLTLEEAHEEELNSIYQLLGAAAFTNRTNMNLASKTNHYITHDKGQLGHKPDVACEECWKHFEHVVTKMPELPQDGNGSYFDSFYRQPYEMLKKMREEKIK